MSTDPAVKLAKFRVAVGADYRFVADENATLARRYGVKMPLVKVANRATFVIGRDRRILAVLSGSEAIDPAPALAACPLRSAH